MCGVSGTRETHWRRRRRRWGEVDGSRIELGEVWRGRCRERRDQKGGVDKKWREAEMDERSSDKDSSKK